MNCSDLTLLSVGSRNHTSLSENAVLACRHADRFARWKRNVGEVGKEQTETDHVRAGRKVGKRIEGCQICWMFGIDTGEKRHDCLCFVELTDFIIILNIAERLEECFWRSDSCCPWATRARQEEAMQDLVKRWFDSRRDTIKQPRLPTRNVSFYYYLRFIERILFVFIVHAFVFNLNLCAKSSQTILSPIKQ